MLATQDKQLARQLNEFRERQTEVARAMTLPTTGNTL
jgi:phosphoribosylcarboxyaminoimidazole (NCAIR) mutase